MKERHWTYTSTTANFEVDLAQNQQSDLGIVGECFEISDFDIEVTGNDAAVTLTAKGPFPTSTYNALTDGVFAISGGKRSISGFALRYLNFSRTGTTPYTINIVRRVRHQ